MPLKIKSNVKKNRLQVLYCSSTVPLIVVFLFIVMPLPSHSRDSWQVQGLSIQSQNNGIKIHVDSLTWQESQTVGPIDYWCPDSLPLYPIHQCNQAEILFSLGEQKYTTTIDSAVDFNDSQWQIMLGTTDEQLGVLLSSEKEVAQIQLKQLKLESMIRQLFPDFEIPSIPTGIFNGELIFDIEQGLLKVSEPIVFNGINYEYSDDVIVAELVGELIFELDMDEQLLNYQLKLNKGEMLFNEVYVDFSSYPIVVNGELVWQDDEWYLLSTKMTNEQSLQLTAQMKINKSFEWQDPNIHVEVIDSHHLNQHILENILGIYGFGDSGMSGQFEVVLTSQEQVFDHWLIIFNDYYFLNEPRKIAAEALNGQIEWHQGQANKDSNLFWQSMELAGLPINAAEINFNLSQDQFELIGEHQFPVFNGAIELQELELGALFSDSIDMSLNASILPISLKLITEKMGWPVMAGTISGDIPGMVKQGNVIKFLGALDLKVFAGDMLVENLSLERLFGVAPVIAADVQFDEFDLSLLTETFGFGLITGKLSGVVDDLRITNWKTDRLDAEVYTVKVKGTKQTISQRAIDNISSLGGIKGAVSKSFLRFFEDFRYKQIKLSCKLHNSVCKIGGLKNQNNQFVIVEGGGIPKINIVGYVRSINWEEFVSRLINANYDN